MKSGELFVELIYMISMIAPVAVFFFHFFSGKPSFDSFSGYLAFQFSAMWFVHGFWAFLLGWTTFLYMLLILFYTLYLLWNSLPSPAAWLWAIALPATCAIVFLSILFSLLKLEEVIFILFCVAFIIWGIINAGLNPVKWVHTHDVKDRHGQTVGKGYTAKPNVGKSHRPDRIDPP